MSLDQTVEFYNDQADEFFKSTINVDMSDIYSKFLSHLPSKSLILDAGCGSGRDSKYFTDNGFKVTSFDASTELCRLSSKYLNKKVHCYRFDEISYQNQFNGIWACASLLHLSNKELIIAMKKLTYSLRANGIIYCSFKRGVGEKIINGRYFNFQNIQSFQKLIANTPELNMLSNWESTDNRKDRKSEVWFNAILRRE
jgi:SAM-dependent methyltransferase